MWDRPLDKMFARLVVRGTLKVTFADNRTKHYGDGSGVPVAVMFTDAAVARKLILNPELALGEAYMDGTLIIENDDLLGMLTMLMQNAKSAKLGWGSTSLTLARDYGAQVVGVTLSQAQLDHARKRVDAAGLSDQIEFRLTDYRDVDEEFDRIVVVGMLEHVGQPQYRRFFQQIRRNLKPDGIALLHTIGRSTPPDALSPWFNKYIFPGGYSPALSEIMGAVEKSDLFVTDVEVWRMHYVRTLQHWRKRFETNIDAIRDLYDERFCRMWRYYLIASELSFTVLGMVAFQLQISRDQIADPLKRDYMFDA